MLILVVGCGKSSAGGDDTSASPDEVQAVEAKSQKKISGATQAHHGVPFLQRVPKCVSLIKQALLLAPERSFHRAASRSVKVRTRSPGGRRR